MSNIYLNEFDRFVKHQLKPLAYLRYGDDWLCFANDAPMVQALRHCGSEFLQDELLLTINPKLDYVRPAHRGVAYLGVDLWPTGRRLQSAVQRRIQQRLNYQNAASYRALVQAHSKPKKLKEFDWLTSWRTL